MDLIGPYLSKSCLSVCSLVFQLSLPTNIVLYGSPSILGSLSGSSKIRNIPFARYTLLSLPLRFLDHGGHEKYHHRSNQLGWDCRIDQKTNSSKMNVPSGNWDIPLIFKLKWQR